MQGAQASGNQPAQTSETDVRTECAASGIPSCVPSLCWPVLLLPGFDGLTVRLNPSQTPVAPVTTGEVRSASSNTQTHRGRGGMGRRT
jgi:hypothetical protein